MRLLHKPLFAALAFLVVLGIGGTTYAAVNGGLSSITALFGGESKIANARIVKVELQNCHDVNPFNVVSGTGKGDTPRYYRVKDSANINNKEVVSFAQAICRASYNPPAEAALMRQVENQPENKGKLVGNAEGTIIAISPNAIDIQVSGKVTANHQPYIEHFTEFDPELAVFDGSGERKGVSALKVGDHVYSSYRSMPSGAYSTETTALENVDWSMQTLVTISKESADEAKYNTFTELSQSKLIEQVAHCKNNASGYCTFDELHE